MERISIRNKQWLAKEGAMTRGKKKVLLFLFGFLCALSLAFGAMTFGGRVFARAAEDHSADTALTNAYITSLEQNEDGTAYLLPSGNYYLSANVTTTKTIALEDGAAVSLCLNGKSITFTGDANYRYPVFRVENASMTVTDCVGDGKIDGGNRSGSVIYVEEGNFTLAGGGITGGRGTIRFDPYTNCAEVDGKEGYGYGEEGFYIQGGGVFALDSNLVITGGAIYGNGVASADARWYGEDVTKYEREDIGNKTYEGAIVEGGNHITYHSGDTVQISRAQGGGVFIGTTYENRDTDKKSTFVMSGGAISNNVSYLHGAGMFVHNVDFEMRGGVIGGEHRYISSYSGSGATIAFTSGGNVAQAGLQGLNGTLAGGIYIYRGNERGDGNDVKLSGTAEISYNVAGSGSAFLLVEGSTIDISGSVVISHNVSTNGAVMSVSGSSFTMSGGTIEENSGSNQLSVSMGTYSASFTMSGGYIRNNTGGSLGSESEAGKGAGTLLSVSSTADQNKIDLSGVVITENEAYANAGVSISGGSVTVKNVTYSANRALQYYNTSGKLTSGAAVFTISNPATLTVTESTFSGNTAMGGNAGLSVSSRSNTQYTISDVNISDNSATAVSGLNISPAVSTEAGGTVNLENVTISGNTTSGNYAGLYVSNFNFGLTLNLTDVNVLQNTARSSYAGVLLGQNVKATMTGGSISSNSAGLMGEQGKSAGVSGSNAGLYLTAGSATYTSGGKDVVLKGASMDATNVTIANNVAANSSAGVYVGGGAVQNKSEAVVVDGASLTMENCSVMNNTVTGYYKDTAAVSLSGGSYAGIYVVGGATKVNEVYYAHRGTLEMNGGSVSGNVGVTSSGIYTAGDVELTNVTVDNNAAGYQRGFNVSTDAGNNANGAGIYITVSSSVRKDDTSYLFRMTGGSVSGNTATGSGGAIYANGGNNRKLDVILDGVTVSGNAATGYFNGSAMTSGTGGGMYFTYLTATISDCTVSYNTARTHGGGIYATYSELTLSNTDVVNNTAGEFGSAESAGIAGYGGGIYLAGGYNASIDQSLTFEMNGGSVSNNTATRAGGIYLAGGSDAQTRAMATVADVTISYNAATGYYNTKAVRTEGEGGGIYINYAVSAPTVTLEGGSVQSNSAFGNGGGIYVGGGAANNYAALSLEGTAAIKGNFAGYGNTAVCYGGGVYAHQFAHVTVSGTAYVKTNSVLKTTDGEQTATASNVYLYASSQATAAKIYVGALSGTACIYVTARTSITSDWYFVFADGTDAYDASSWFGYDVSGYKVVFEDSVLRIAEDEAAEGDEATNPSEDYQPGSQENPAINIGVTVTVTDAEGNLSSGGVLQGVTSLYYDGVNEEMLQVGYTITIRDGYYLASVIFNGAKYYFNSYDGFLYVTTDGSAGTRCDVSPFTYEGGVLTFKAVLVPEEENALTLAVGEIKDPFTVSDTAAVFDGSAKHVSVSKNSTQSAVPYVSEFASYVSTYSIEYMIDGIWTTEEPIEAGIYAVRVTWTNSPYVGGSSFGADLWTLSIGAQVWGDDTENIDIRLSEDEFVYQNGEFTPDVTVIDTARGNKTLTVGVDYEITYSNNKAAGTGIVIVTGIGNYDGTLSATFVISKAPNTVSYDGDSEYEGVFTGRATTIDLGSISAVLGSVSYAIEGPDGASVSIASGIARFTFVNAGEYSVVFTSEGNTNYASHSVRVSVVIAKAENSIDVSGVEIGTYTYNGADQYFDLSKVTAYVGLSGLVVEVSGGGSYNPSLKTVTLKDAGSYTVTLRIPETENYTAAEQVLVVRVSPQQIVKPSEDTTEFVYDGTVKTYTVASSGYYSVVGGSVSKTEAGSSVILIALSDTKNTCWADGTTDELRYTFTILKADPDYTVPTDLSATAGDSLSDIALPAGWAWDDPSSKVDAMTLGYSATFTPADSANYNTVKHEVNVKVTPAVIVTGDGDESSVSSDTGFVVETQLSVSAVAEENYDFDRQTVIDAVVNSLPGVLNFSVDSVYDVSLTSGGQNVTVSQATGGGVITVTLTVPEELLGQAFYIVHVHNGEVVSVLFEDDGYTLHGKTVSFEADQLSQFVFVTEQPAEAPVGLIVTFAVVDVVLIAVVVILLVNKRKKLNAEN